MKRSVLALCVLLLTGAAAGAQPQGGQPGEDWERRPDGTVVIDIHGRRFAFPPELQGLVVFEHGDRNVPLREAIARPAEMRRWWAPSHPTMPVGLALSARLVAPLLFDGPAPVDRTGMRPWPVFWIWIYRDPEWTECRRRPEGSLDRRVCDYFLERARDDTAVNPDGFLVERPAMLRGTGKTYYVFPERERRAAPGDPAHIACLPFSRSSLCENGSSLGWGYFIRPGIFLRYQYSMSKANPQDMRAIDDAFRRVVERLLLEPAPAAP